MPFPLYKARLYLYWSFLLWTILLFALSLARLSYTEDIPKGDPLNNGKDFFDPSVVALLVSSLLALLWTPVMLYTLISQYIHAYLTLVYFELAVAGVLWILWLGSTAAATNVWPNLSFCVQFRACTNLQAMIAFAWLGWIALTVLILLTVVTAIRTKAWREHSHGPWADGPLFWGLNRSVSGEPRLPTPDFGFDGTSAGPQMRAAEAV
ncbi:hypothetical protein K439DRAFT_152591 [Ramaria rubella]|nr:hypothetical protein K439DRAFT_152591 [Ramaria rubella]